MRRLLLLIAIGLVVTSLTAVAAQAGKPLIVERNNSLTRQFLNIPTCQSFGFTHSETYQVTRSITEFYDREGNLVREVLHVRFIGTATNDKTGKTLPVTGTRHLVFDADGTFTETGVLRHVTVSGQGIVLHESGRIVWPADESLPPQFVAGPHQLMEGDVAAFCAALAGS